ncbi:MAG: hypothetical protein JXB04_10455 [Kiritimatiellae bacterium]|nr:hypothetical protein [Kiritimatiellia bacterium]
MVRTLAILAVLLLGLTFYLGTLGFPRAVRGRVVAALGRQGVIAEIDRIRWSPLSGVMVDGLRVFDWPDAPCPVIEVRRLLVDVDVAALARRSGGLDGVEIRGGVFRLSTRGPLTQADRAGDLTARDIGARVLFEPGGLRIEDLVASVAGIRVQGRGTIARAREVRERVTFAQWIRGLEERLAAPDMAWAGDLALELRELQHAEAPVADVRFSIYPGQDQLHDVALDLHGGRTVCRGVSFEEWRLSALLQEGRLKVSRALLRRGAHAAEASLTVDLATLVAEGRVRSDLPPAAWFPLVPAAWTAEMRRQGVFAGGSLRADVMLGPALIGELHRHAHGRLALSEAEVQGAWIESAAFDLACRGDVVEFTGVDAVLGRGGQRGRVQGRATYRLDTGRYEGHAITSFDPNALITLLNASQARIVGAFDFHESPPCTELGFSGLQGDPREFRLQGVFHGTNFYFQGAYVGTLDTGVAIPRPGVLRLDPFVLTRDEGTATGWIEQDFDHQLVDADIVSTINPKSIAQMIGPGPEEIMEPFMFHGPTRVAARGRVDYGTREQTDFSADVDGDRMQLLWFKADQCSFKLVGRGPRVEAQDIRGELYGGQFSGTAVIYPVESSTNVRYEVSMIGEDVGLRQVAEALQEADPDTNATPRIYEGRLSAAVTVAGFMGEGRGKTAEGEGRMRVRDGRLFDIPLLGGLSRVLSRIQPGWGYAQQTDFRAAFTIANGRFTTENLRLEGDAVTVLGRGHYYFNEKLDFEVEVQFLRRSKMNPVINLVTLPFRKLFLFHLGGYVDDPRWRPINFPKELFLIFD